MPAQLTTSACVGDFREATCGQGGDCQIDVIME